MTALPDTPAVARRIDAMNPVTTLGAMQVSATFAAREVEKANGRPPGMSAPWRRRAPPRRRCSRAR